MKKKIAFLMVALLCFWAVFNAADVSNGTPNPSADASMSTEMIPEADESAEESSPVQEPELVLRYDDRYEFAKEIQAIDSEEIFSHQVDSEAADTEVLKCNPDNASQVIAVGCGTAKVSFQDGSMLRVQVDPAPISLLLIAGQSNGEGRPSDVRKLEQLKKQWVANKEGMVYSTYGPSDTRARMNMYEEVCWYEDTENVGALSVKNFERFLPKSLTQNEVNDNYNRTDNLTNAENALGKGGIDSALAYRWTQLTGEKVWIVNAAHHGTGINRWNPDDSDKNNEFWEAVALYTGAEEILSKEIVAGHYTLAHKGIFWYQGESDYGTGDEYAPQFLKMNEAFMTELDGHGIPGMEKDIAFTGILMVRATLDKPTSSADFFLTGPRRVQFYLAMDSEYPTILMASQAEEDWSCDETVEAYFQKKYGSQEKYASSLPLIGGEASMPACLNDVHSQVHYMQLAYNEIGVDAAENICYALHYAQAPSDKIERIEAVTEDGITVRNGQTITVSQGEERKFAVKVYPAYLAKTVEVVLSDSLKWSSTGIKSESPEVKEMEVQIKDGTVYLLGSDDERFQTMNAES